MHCKPLLSFSPLLLNSLLGSKTPVFFILFLLKRFLLLNSKINQGFPSLGLHFSRSNGKELRSGGRELRSGAAVKRDDGGWLGFGGVASSLCGVTGRRRMVVGFSSIFDAQKQAVGWTRRST